MSKRVILWLPLAIGLLLFGMFYANLKNPSDRVIASQVVGQKLPEFRTLAAVPGHQPALSADFRDGKPRLLNIFASWCVPCVQEIPMLLRLQAQGVEIDGLAVHDTPADLAAFLANNGNPYRRIGLDDQGRAQLAFGSAGVPETFVVDGSGTIVHQHIGIVTESDIPIILAKLGQAQ